MLQLQEQCAKFQPEPNTYAYDDFPDNQSHLPDLHYQLLSAANGDRLAAFRTPPECWTSYKQFFESGPAPGSLGTGDIQDPGTLLYLGHRTTSSGKEYIVAAWLQLNKNISPRAFSRFSICAVLVTLGTRDSRPAVVGSFGIGSDLAASVPIRFEIGTADPSDASKFNIPWRVPSGAHTLHGEIVESSGSGIAIAEVRFSESP